MFDKTLAKYGGKIDPAAVVSYPASSSTTGDPTVAQEQAPTIITKLKDAGVTTVILLADSAMIGALTSRRPRRTTTPSGS